jgi:leucyl/phenylalanyl-tRNA--protein transferase
MQKPVPWISGSEDFPPPESADERGFVCAGGDLSMARLLRAYRSGIFPWSVRPVTWWSPDPRGVFEFDAVHIGKSLARTIRKRRFSVTFDRAFAAVVRACAAVPRQGDDTWIRPEFVDAYEFLHREGWAHSCECWLGDQLVGGVYGVAIGGFFAGESMFHHEDDASKVAVVALLEHLNRRGYQLFDTQMLTSTTRALGAVEIPRALYLRRLAAALETPCHFHAPEDSPH